MKTSIPTFRLSTVQTVAIGAASAATTNGFGDGVFAVRVIATQPCFIVIAKTPTATTSSTYMAAGDKEYFLTSPGEKLAVLEVSAAGGTVYVTELTK